MQAKKGIVNQRYKTLLVRETAAVQKAHLKKEFELAEASRVAEAACALTAQAIESFEKTKGKRRLKPAELLLEENGHKIVLPFLNEKALLQLKKGTSYRAVKRELEILKNYIGETDREMFVVAMLDTKNKVIGINTVSIGSLNSSTVHPREVLKPAILSNSAGIIISHNHPSGDPTPSREDLNITKRLVDACELIGIQLLDHIVIGDEYLSFKEKGLI